MFKILLGVAIGLFVEDKWSVWDNLVIKVKGWFNKSEDE